MIVAFFLWVEFNIRKVRGSSEEVTGRRRWSSYKHGQQVTGKRPPDRYWTTHLLPSQQPMRISGVRRTDIKNTAIF